VDPAALPAAALEDGPDGVDQAAVGVADDELDAVRPRSRRSRRNSVQNASVSLSPLAQPSTSRRPSADTPVAMTTAWETTRWLMRTLQ
jgi:hypothetical protein